MPRSKSRATVEVGGERRVLEVAHAGRAHAGVGQPVVEPGGGAVAEVGADRLVDRREHLEQDEDDADERRAGRRGRRRAGRRRRARPSRSRTPPAAAPRSTSTTHHAAASGRSAFGRTAKNFHSLPPHHVLRDLVRSVPCSLICFSIVAVLDVRTITRSGFHASPIARTFRRSSCVSARVLRDVRFERDAGAFEEDDFARPIVVCGVTVVRVVERAEVRR